MKQYIDKDVVVAKIERLIDSHKPLKTLDPTYYEGLNDSLDDILSFLDTLEVKETREEPVSNDLEEAAYQFGNCFENHFGLASMSFIKGAKWQKEQTIYKACNYLFSHIGLFVTFFDDDIVEDIERSEFIKKFRKEMEDKL